MKFYSYEYVLSQISQQNWVMVILSALLIFVTAFFAFKAYQDKRGSKFRELSIISILALVAVVLISISNYFYFYFSDCHESIFLHKKYS